MPVYSGAFEYLDERGERIGQGSCHLSFEEDTCTVAGSSAPALSFDPGDIYAVGAGEWDLRLTLFTGRTVVLQRFGPAFGRMKDELMAVWRDRVVSCLLLEDLDEIARYDGSVNGSPAQIRLYKSNLAVLPADGPPAQVRLAEVRRVRFDEAAYSVVLESEGGQITIGRLAKKTDDFRGKLGSALDALRANSAEALHEIFPFLDADALASLLSAMPEGFSAPVSALANIHPKLPAALIERAVDSHLEPYFEVLRSRAPHEGLMAGFKFIREEDVPADPETEEEQAEPPAGESEEKYPLFFWFFFPLPGGVVAWEAATGSGRATYFFRIDPGEAVEAAVARLTRGLALVSFRREPVYLPDDSLERQSRFHRYAIGCRKLADLRRLRAAYLGRAIHSSLEAWSGQVAAIVK